MSREPGEPKEKKEAHGYVIEQGVPLPKHARGLRWSPLVEALCVLEAEESLVADTDGKHQRYKARKRNPKFRFCVEKIKDGEHKGKFRIWRAT